MVSTFTVDVAVFEFFFRCGTDGDDFDIEVQRLTGERVVGVNGDRIVINPDDGHHPRTIRRIGLEFITKFDFVRAGKTVSLHFGHQRIVVRAITVFGRNHDGKGIAYRLPGERRFESGNDVVCPVEIDQRRAPSRRVQDIPVVILKGVVDTDNGLIGRLHGENPE